MSSYPTDLDGEETENEPKGLHMSSEALSKRFSNLVIRAIVMDDK